ncbi:MAG TPA: RDD family protein [Tepidisphaeraceae bacterium]|jgi:uncharacterized RDD family membrane protein YckC|nr:RDD family protein [Tepidisphaeraceae bacterium]
MPREQFALRAQALAVDVLVAAVAMLTAGFLVGMRWGSTAAMLAAAITGALYTTIEIFTAASPGKMCLNLKIAGVYSYQARRVTLLARWAAKNTPWLLKIAGMVTGSEVLGWSGMAVGVALVSGFFLALRPEGQTLLDRLAGTVVGSGQPRTPLVFPLEETEPEVDAGFFRQAA